MEESFRGFEDISRLSSWIGSDICVAGEVDLLPGATGVVPVRILPEHFPEVPRGPYQGMVKRLSFSTRSCFAQSGVFVADTVCYEIRNSVLRQLNEDGESVVGIPVRNLGYTHMRIADEVGLLRLFHLALRDKLRGSRLYANIRNGNIEISGTYGKTWVLIDSHGNYLPEYRHAEAENLILMLSNVRYKSEAPAQEELPVSVKTKKDLSRILRPLKPHEQPHFVIGETHPVALGKGIYGKIFTYAYTDEDRMPF